MVLTLSKLRVLEVSKWAVIVFAEGQRGVSVGPAWDGLACATT
jgi:hypothetical protein